MANIKLGDSILMTETNGVATLNVDDATVTTLNVSNINGGEVMFAGPDTSASLLQNTTMAKNTSLPVFAIRAYCFFDGTATSTVSGETHCQIQSCGNISKVVRTSAGVYTAYFETPMPDNKYMVTGSSNPNNYSGTYFGVNYHPSSSPGKATYLTDRFSIDLRNASNNNSDDNYITFIVVR